MELFDEEAIAARRVELPKSLAKKKKQEAAAHDLYQAVVAKVDRVYGLAFRTREGVERIFYVGIAHDYAARWEQHKRAIRLGIDLKPAYEQAKFIGLDNIYMVHLDPEGEFTEADWVNILKEQGHPLTNVAGAVSVKRKKRSTNKLLTEYRRVQSEALMREFRELAAARSSAGTDR